MPCHQELFSARFLFRDSMRCCSVTKSLFALTLLLVPILYDRSEKVQSIFCYYFLVCTSNSNIPFEETFTLCWINIVLVVECLCNFAFSKITVATSLQRHLTAQGGQDNFMLHQMTISQIQKLCLTVPTYLECYFVKVEMCLATS